MKIITYNIWGLGRGLKWGPVKKLVVNEQVDMLCLQETKKEMLDRTMCQALWGNSEVKWAANPAVNSAGGILCIWSESSFELEKEVIGSRFILLEGIWKDDGQKSQL